MKLFAEPEVKVIRLDVEDVIAASGGYCLTYNLDEDELPPIIIG